MTDDLGRPVPIYPIREKSTHGQPPPETSIERTCRSCHASFAGMAAGITRERGIWEGYSWYCSTECVNTGPRPPKPFSRANKSEAE